MSILRNFTAATLLLSLCAASYATVYKTTDANGNVSFTDAPSNEPAAGSTQETIKIQKHVNTTQSDKSQQQMEQDFAQESENRSNDLKSKWEQYDQSMKEAKQQLKKAQSDLVTAKEFTEGDRVFTKTATGGFSRESQQYKERTAEAQQNLSNAQDTMKAAKKLKPRESRPAKEYKTLKPIHGGEE